MLTSPLTTDPPSLPRPPAPRQPLQVSPPSSIPAAPPRTKLVFDGETTAEYPWKRTHTCATPKN